MTTAPEYPGYGQACNGCGECCKDQPCPVAKQYDLWRPATGCRALAFRAGRYWCDVITNPGRVSVQLRKLPIAVRVECIGIAGKCDAKRA